ncbi:phospholipase A2 [Ranunculus cassubicifolius]
MAANSQFLKLALYSLFLLLSNSITIHALNVGLQNADSAFTLGKDCSRKCESENCALPPLLRYGKYCGLMYSGCPGERPCDGLDACCMKHDVCIQVHNNEYLNTKCNQGFLDCMNNFQNTGAVTFKGNKCDADEVIDVISVVIEAALLAGRVLHKP